MLFLTVTLVHLIALMIPRPDFFLCREPPPAVRTVRR
jgi:hypothetical protein